jgi:hypothetical protein
LLDADLAALYEVPTWFEFQAQRGVSNMAVRNQDQKVNKSRPRDFILFSYSGWEVLANLLISGGWYWDRTSGPCRVKPGLSMYASFVIGEAVPATPDFFDVVFCNIDRELG